MYERRTDPLMPRRQFLVRLARSGALAVALAAFSLLIGMIGYHSLENLGWLDAFLNAAMLLGGMGPVNTPASEGGKLFAGLYALYCGLVVIVATGVLLAPIAHRMLHKFHIQGANKQP